MRVSAQSVESASESGSKQYRYAPGTNRLIGIVQAGQDKPAVNAPQMKEEVAHWLRTAWLYHPTGVPLARFDTAAGQHRRIVYNSAKRPVAAHDAQNRLMVRYRYNLQGERIARTVYEVKPAMQQVTLKTGDMQKDVIGQTTYNLYRDQRLAGEADGEGRITAHYVYFNGMPVAKIETAPNTGIWHALWKVARTAGGLLKREEPQASDSVASIYAIHTDQRGAPQLVTDETQHIVWQADTNAFGKAHVRYAAESGTQARKFEMNLRLPGQVYDPQTGLHDNYLRDYDPDTGRYTTPDPLGLSGGMNPYAYVSNNPLTSIDPLGLYQSDIHYYLTYFLAIVAGVNAHDARMIALADQYVDSNPLTRPLENIPLISQPNPMSVT